MVTGIVVVVKDVLREVVSCVVVRVMLLVDVIRVVVVASFLTTY